MYGGWLDCMLEKRCDYVIACWETMRWHVGKRCECGIVILGYKRSWLVLVFKGMSCGNEDIALLVSL